MAQRGWEKISWEVEGSITKDKGIEIKKIRRLEGERCLNVEFGMGNGECGKEKLKAQGIEIEKISR
ncbi:MAG: hypothetical protein PVF37_05685 [Desulfobacterales bacterium]|jgi:hypothetical protein